MQVSFYGHTRQYENLKSEIDANMNEVLQSTQRVSSLCVLCVRSLFRGPSARLCEALPRTLLVLVVLVGLVRFRVLGSRGVSFSG